ncbi:hypothetical protein BKA67DRAFT_691500 [Truncatella angustata]|uniref:Uncharacterized protein n=1 Tax=Truncatella angustata TaxID=152316 RepID=A0A9P8ZXU3_9PEZI|nr:uncharacterized protein BKA67DRAFT_691500 [Truncatella angustata]KAH6654483.1 hypothetical protein BKA67DRAFT_691500 [Truncatella angustata]
MSAQGYSFEEQMQFAKELRDAYNKDGNGTHNLRGRGIRVGRGSSSGHGGRFSSALAKSESSVTSSVTSPFSPSQYTSRPGVKTSFAGNGGFSPEALARTSSFAGNSSISTAATASPKPTEEHQRNTLPPHLRIHLHHSGAVLGASQSTNTSTSTTDKNPPVLHRSTNDQKRVVPRSNDSDVPVKRARKDCSADIDRQNGVPIVDSLRRNVMTNEENVPTRDSQDQLSSTAGVELNMTSELPLVEAQGSTESPSPVSAQSDTNMQPVQSLQHTHNVSDIGNLYVKMAGMDIDDDNPVSRQSAKKHGGILESKWADNSCGASTAVKQAIADPWERWIPTHISHPTPAPAHIVSLLGGQDIEKKSNLGKSSQVVPRSYQVTLEQSSVSYGPRRGNGRGGMAASRYAS